MCPMWDRIRTAALVPTRPAIRPAALHAIRSIVRLAARRPALLAATLAVAAAALPARASLELRRSVQAEIRRIQTANDPATLRLRLPLTQVDPNDLQFLQQALQDRLPDHGFPHPRILVEIARTRAYGRNPDGAMRDVDRALALLEAEESLWAADPQLGDDAYSLWGTLELMAAVKDQSPPQAQKVADRISGYLVREVRRLAPAEIPDRRFMDLSGEDAWKVLKGFLNLHQGSGAEVELTLARAFYQAHLQGETRLVRLASNCAAAVVASPPKDYRAYLLYGLFEMGLPLREDHELGIESLRAGTALIPDSLSWKRFFASPDSFFAAKGLEGPRPVSREEIARYRCHLIMADLWMGDPYLDLRGWDTLPGIDIVLKGSPISVETELARSEADVDTAASLPMKDSPFRNDANGRFARMPIGAYDWKPTTTTYVFLNPNGGTTRSSYETFGRRAGAGRRHSRGERGRQMEELTWETEQAAKDRAVTAYQKPEKPLPLVFVREATFLNPYPQPLESPVRAAFTVGIVPPPEDPDWDRDRKLRVQLFEGENPVPWVTPLETEFRYVRKQQLPNGTSIYLEEVITKRLQPGTYRLGIEMNTADPNEELSFEQESVVVDDYDRPDLLISDFRVRTRGAQGEWLPSALDRVCGSHFSFDVEVYHLRRGADGHPRYETTYAIFRRADFDEKVLPELQRRRAAGQPAGLDAFSALALEPVAPIPPNERTSVAGVGGFEYKGPRDPGMQVLSVDLNVAWLEIGSYIVVLEVRDIARVPMIRAFRAVPFRRTAPEDLLRPDVAAE